MIFEGIALRNSIHLAGGLYEPNQLHHSYLMKTNNKLLASLMAAAFMFTFKASPIAYTIIEDSDTSLTALFHTQIYISPTGRGYDMNGSFTSVYWSGNIYYSCQPDIGSWVSFGSDYTINHRSAGTGADSMLGSYESMFRSDTAYPGHFVAQPYYTGNPRDWFQVDTSYTYNPSTRILDVGGTLRASRNIPGVPDSGSTIVLLVLPLALLFLSTSGKAKATQSQVR